MTSTEYNSLVLSINLKLATVFVQINTNTSIKSREKLTSFTEELYCLKNRLYYVYSRSDNTECNKVSMAINSKYLNGNI
jgi:hypothetical protein